MRESQSKEEMGKIRIPVITSFLVLRGLYFAHGDFYN